MHFLILQYLSKGKETLKEGFKQDCLKTKSWTEYQNNAILHQ